MNNVEMFFLLLSVGVMGHLIMRRSVEMGKAIRSMFNISGEGEGGEGGKAPTFTAEQQEFINGLVAKERKTTEGKFGDYGDLKKFKTEFEQNKERQGQEDLEKGKKYDEAKKGYETKIGELSGKLTAAETRIQNIQIDNALGNEISKQGGYNEETLAMIRGNAVMDANGSITIKTKDKNGADINVPLADGVKQFLTERPHLVRSNYKGGSGAGGGQNREEGAGGGAGEETLDALNAKLAVANKGTDLKERSRLRGLIKEKLAAKGVHK